MKNIILLCLSVALLAACNKADDIIDCAPLPAATMAGLSSAAPSVQTFTFDLGQPQSLRTLKGATVAFGASVFLLPNGAVATGQGQLRLREIYAVPDMLLADMPTYTNFYHQVLISGGEFDIQVWQGTSRLRLAPFTATGQSQRVTLTSPVPTAGLDTTRMLLWKQPATGQARDSAGWLLAPNISSPQSSTGTITVPATAGNYTAAIPLDSISKWNIDQFWHAYQSSGASNIGVELPSAPSSTVTVVYFRPVGFNGLARAIPAPYSSTFWYCSLPLGADVIAVVLQERGGQLYYGTQRFITSRGLQLSPPLEALPAAEIVRRIRLL